MFMNQNRLLKKVCSKFYVFFLAAIILYSHALTSAQDYVIGAPASLTGADADNGQQIINSLKLYVDQVNKFGGIQGHNLVLKVLDDKSDPAEAQKNAQILSNDSTVIAVVGHTTQATATAAAPVYNKAGLVLFTPSELDTAVTKANPWAYSGMYAIQTQQQMLAAYIKVYEPTPDLLVINGSGDKSKDLVSSFVDYAKKAGLNVQTQDTADASLIIDAAKKPASIVLYAEPVAANAFVKKIRAAGLNTPVFGDAYILTEMTKHLNDAYTANVFATFPFSFRIAPIEAQRFSQAYTATYNAAPSVNAAFAYDGISLIARSLRQDNLNRGKIHDYLATLTTPEAGQSGITGRLYFDATNHISHNIIVCDQFQGSIRPDFDQLKRAPAAAVSDSEHDIAVVDHIPYYKVSVVYMGLDFKKITKLDSSKKEVEVDTFLWFKWRGNVNPDDIIVQNQAGDSKRVQIKRTVLVDPSQPTAPTAIAVKGATGPAAKLAAAGTTGAAPTAPQNTEANVNYAAYSAKIPLTYDFDLRAFPFDRQIIPITISHDVLDTNRIVLAVEPDFINKNKVSHPEWTNLARLDSSGSFSYSSTLGNYKRSELGTNIKPEFSTYEIYLVMKRKVFSYLFSIFLPIFIIVGICFMGFMIPIATTGDVNSRRSLVTGMLFATVVSHLAMRNSLQTTYLVAADYFYLLAYVVICAEMLAFSIEGLIIGKNLERALFVDRVSRAVIIAGTVLATIWLMYAFVR